MSPARMPSRRPPARTGKEQHRAWLELVDTEGPFLAVPPLLRVWGQGMPPLADDAKQALVDSKPAFERAWDVWDRHPDDDSALAAFRAAREYAQRARGVISMVT